MFVFAKNSNYLVLVLKKIKEKGIIIVVEFFLHYPWGALKSLFMLFSFHRVSTAGGEGGDHEGGRPWYSGPATLSNQLRLILLNLPWMTSQPNLILTFYVAYLTKKTMIMLMAS